ncbi:tRNA glutamyl-Q(34) synthetase GluQRS [Teredinibacter waterburyi]|uniref:tRNA glutamyl-Q(34) synthetase GluQRS n=1 Tax=Teredinibacter waterburyi TaxID=1500538 RepID=UPI00165F35C6|nr:tRNA glutamyl-Q(34) synthetase GluQRS [Teredinibacter waterburyi]
MVYIGRFAPSPSGPLHLGSLLCAVTSYLDARAHQGRWLVRIEDIDPPREQPGADRQILEALVSHGLIWDAEPLYQSQRTSAYQQALKQLTAKALAYRCNCTRARIKALGGRYDGHCRQHAPADTPCAIRLALSDALIAHPDNGFNDLLLGPQGGQLERCDDFIIHRKDGLFAYQLAVVVDDAYQNVSHVIRGADLLCMTSAQQLLHKLFGAQPPEYGHHPLITDSDGNKLSKQNHARAIDHSTPTANLLKVFTALGLPCDADFIREYRDKTPAQLLQWATNNWSRSRVNSTHSTLASLDN